MPLIQDLKKLSVFFDRSDVPKLIGIFAIILLSAAVEILGVGALIPVVGLLTDPNFLDRLPFLKHLLSLIFVNNQAEFLRVFLWFIVALFLVKNIFLILSKLVQNRFLLSKYAQLSSRMFDTYLNAPYAFHLQCNSSELLRNVRLAHSIMIGVVFPFLGIFSEIVIMVVLFSMTLIHYLSISVILLFTTGIAAFGSFYLFRNHLTKLGRLQNYHNACAIQQVNQGLGSIKETIVLNKAPFFASQYEKHVKEHARILMFYDAFSSAPRNLIEFMAISTVCFVILYMTTTSATSEETLMTLSVFTIIASRVMPSMSKLNAALSMLKFYLPGVDELYDDVRELPKVNPVDISKITPMKFDRSIEIDNLFFKHANTEQWTIDGISLSIKKNSKVGFAGTSGAGKTTFVDLILGLHRAHHGQILVDGVSVYDHLSEWRAQIGYIPQSIYLIDDSIRNNVAFGVEPEKIDDAKIWKALETAQLADFVREQPERLDAKVGELGVRISGGQRQRIGIARAVYHEPNVLIMDEATSALDNRTEKDFLEAVNSVRGKKTILIIAHRITTIKDCDQIFVFEKGRLIDFGAYNVLLERSESFRRLASISI